MSKTLQKAIEKTLAYGKRFGIIYGTEEIKQRLISDKLFGEEEIEKEFKKCQMTNVKCQIRDNKMDKARKLAELIGKYFKDILMIGVTGSVAAGYPKKNDDIDLMIVTKKDRLWLTRLFVRIFVCVKNIPHRRYNVKEAGDEFCFNLWLEEDVLELPKNRQNLQNAMDAILMKPILDRDNTYKRFMRSNKWIRKYLINTYVKNI